MGVEFRRPPLPAPTESMDENSATETEVATNITTRTDKTSYSIPEDGSPITISTKKLNATKDGHSGHQRGKSSQTSLLIEYFEASKTGDKSRSRPSVRVKVTPSSAKKSKGGNEAIQITGIGTDRKPSYTRRISLGNSSKNVETGLAPTEGTEISHSSGSNVSVRSPLEIEVLNDGSDISNSRNTRSLMYAPLESNVSSMPPDSMLEGEGTSEFDQTYEYERDEKTPTRDTAYLKAPMRTGSRSRSASRERLTQKVMEKLGASSAPHKSSRSKSHDYDYEEQSRERRRRSSKSHRGEADTVSGAESSLLSSDLAPSQRSYRSGSSQASRITNNPRLLEMVEDTIKRVIMPEINAIKEDQRTDRKLRKFSDGGRDSASLERSVSKSSSSPNISSKPKVVLNRDGDDPGTVLSRGDSERIKHRKSSRESPKERPSSRRSSGRQSREGSYDDTEERIRHKSSRGSNTLRGAAAAGMVGAGLTAAALKHHESQGDVHARRKKRSKSRSSRSRSASVDDFAEETLIKETIPPMPLASHINDSEVTRESILSQETDRSHSSADLRTPIREVRRGSLGDSMSPSSSRTPTRASAGRSLGMSLSNQSIDHPRSPVSSSGGITNRERLARLTAAGLGAAGSKGVDADGYGTPRKLVSPVQSVASLRKSFEDDPLIPAGLRPHSAASRSSAGQLRRSERSHSSLRSMESPDTMKLADSRKQSQNIGGYEDETPFETPLERPSPGFARSGANTPSGETAEEWFERQHLVNDRYRNSLDDSTNRDSYQATNRDSYQTNPYPQDEKRFTFATDDSYDRRVEEDDGDGERDVQHLGLNPNYVHTPVAVESAVASLMEPSTVSSHVISSNGSPGKQNGTYSDRMAEHLRAMGKEAPPMYEASTVSQTMPSQDRWAALKTHAQNMSGSLDASPRQSPTKSLQEQQSRDMKPIMSSSGLPLLDDPLPEIGHYDDTKSELETNPSIIQGPLGGDVTGKDTWPYTPEPQHDTGARSSGISAKDGMLAAAAGGAAALATAHAARQPTVEDSREGRDGTYDVDREMTATGSPAFFRDEGYVTDARTRSGGGITPKPEQQRYGKEDLEEYARAMDARSLVEDDPFAAASPHKRAFSGDSHGLESPLYDSSMGKGINNIQSKDIVALMDHLTVRDAQRNARDTEVLVSLVRNAAEMRQSFDEMKRFIVEQDRLIMQNADRSVEHTAQKVLGGPRPQPLGSPRTPRRDSEDDIQTKRKGVLRRALKGLTGGKSSKDLARVEDMLMQILDNVEDLKAQSGGAGAGGDGSRQMEHSYTNDSLDSYERLRNPPDSGYEPDGQAGTSSTPSHSGHFNPGTPREKHQFHSGYDGRRGSDNRVSTVLEDDEDELEPHEAHVLNHQFENNERMLTPTQATHNRGISSPHDTPPQQAPNSSEKNRKHKSNGSSLFGVPKMSRWSKTTTSSAAPDLAALDSPQQARGPNKSFESSRSQSTLDQYDDDEYDDRYSDSRSLAKSQSQKPAYDETRSMRSQGSKLTRTPSPLIPSEASSRHRSSYGGDRAVSPVQHDDEAELYDPKYDDPKYHAHRNSILLQHPQPRPGATPRHQNNLESQAQTFDDPTGTNSDLSQRTVSDFDPAVWGSSATAGLARHRLTQVEPLSPVSMSSPATGYAGRNRDDGPLVPSKAAPPAPPKIRHEPEPEPEDEEEDEDWEPQFSKSGFSKAGYYSSPYGSGHLLEPIEEVRYSLETDSRSLQSVSPEPQLASARAVDMRSPHRKITGPRPMGTRSPAASAKLVETGTGTVRRKPVPRSEASLSDESETF